MKTLLDCIVQFGWDLNVNKFGFLKSLSYIHDIEIDVIEKLGYMGIGSRTAVDLIDMLKNSRISQPYSGGGVGTGKPIIGFGRGNTRIN